MIKHISIAGLLSLVAAFCTLLGYGIGSLDNDERMRLMRESTEKQVQAIQMALDGNMYAAEPFHSYVLSKILYEATLQPEPIPIIQEILLDELEGRAKVVREYCKTRAFSGFRETCAREIEQALKYVNE